jgi:aldehyde dehydrogenase (NAD+)
VCVNPANGETTAVYPVTSQVEIAEALCQARSTYDRWSAIPVSQRMKRLGVLKVIIAEHLDELVETLTSETGKTVQDALGSDIIPLIDAINWLQSAAPRHLRPKRIPGQRSTRLHCRPLGTVAVIGTWNYPFLTDGAALLWALAAGCTVVWKPSELATGSAIALHRLLREAELPVWLVTGGADVSTHLCNLAPDKLAFTGSSTTGRRILAQLAEHGTPSVMELSGKDAMIVLHDADIAVAAKSAVWARVVNAGQTCVAPQRIFVDARISARFTDECLKCIQSLQQGRDYGPLRSESQRAIVHNMVVRAIQQGAALVTGGHCSGDTGYFYQPTLLTGCTDEMSVIADDLFGPVLAITDFNNEDEITRRSNSLDYGLGASIWSRDVNRASKLSGQMRTGMVSINRETQFMASNPAVKFGGCRASGFGSVRGTAGLDEWVVWQPVAVSRRATFGRHLMPYRRETEGILRAFARLKCSNGMQARITAVGALVAAMRAWQVGTTKPSAQSIMPAATPSTLTSSRKER